MLLGEGSALVSLAGGAPPIGGALPGVVVFSQVTCSTWGFLKSLVRRGFCVFLWDNGEDGCAHAGARALNGVGALVLYRTR